ncbi:pyridine nucleotide-disulfide oxidoreductase [Marinicaulis flavus]|uniref:Pyridine nucleotide-disulfide oxidoreductase n=1 Tax=Hyphococcus luteus TaxID=2058213 RepID=A0A2S7K243_9PROT|nr:pyridine nucleotide-disulfide oxidoreductase [Marinicaulis flavus]
MERILIIGAGQAGAQAAVSLRQGGFKGVITMIGAEPAPPYQRPPLSKAYLKGELEEQRLYLRPAEFYEAQEIDLRLGVAATGIDREAKTVVTDEGETLSYDVLLLATGAPPRRLNAPGADLEGVHYLRTLADSERLRPMLSAPGRVVIVGAGYIGLEVAAVARQHGRDVTVLEMAPRVLARVASEPVSEFYQTLHRNNGVDLRLGAAFEAFEGEHRIHAARLKDGEAIDCAAALVGIGAAPETRLAEEAGLEVSNGIVVDEYARTSDPAIFAAGDCTNFPSPRYGRRMRLESVPNAIEQAKAAAANMIGGETVYDALPWFWSDQYDVKLQTVGLCEGYDELVVRGDPAAKKFAVWYLKDGKGLAVDAINDPASFAMGKKLITAGAALDPAKLADTGVDLKTLI